MPFLVCGLVRGATVVNDRKSTKPALFAWKGTLSMSGQPEQFKHAPVPGQGEMRHRLTKLALGVRMLNQVRLVDDVHQRPRLGDAPEDPVDAQAQFPFAVACIAEGEKVGFPQVGMRTLRVPGIEAQEGRYREAAAAVSLDIGGGFPC